MNAKQLMVNLFKRKFTIIPDKFLHYFTKTISYIPYTYLCILLLLYNGCVYYYNITGNVQ